MVETKGGHPRFMELVQQIADLHARKSHDYGGGNPIGNLLNVEEFGVSPFIGVLVRMSDKWARLKSIVKTGEIRVTDEKLDDTLRDLSVYSLLAIVCLELEDKHKNGKIKTTFTPEEMKIIKQALRSAILLEKSLIKKFSSSKGWQLDKIDNAARRIDQYTKLLEKIQ